MSCTHLKGGAEFDRLVRVGSAHEPVDGLDEGHGPRPTPRLSVRRVVRVHDAHRVPWEGGKQEIRPGGS